MNAYKQITQHKKTEIIIFKFYTRCMLTMTILARWAETNA